MSLSAPISVLKSKARRLQHAESIPLHEALRRVAEQEGYGSWSLLVTRAAAERKERERSRVLPGDLVLLGARPGHGKTIMAVKMALEALREGKRAWFFSLENDPPSMPELFRAAGAQLADHADRFSFDGTSGICADYIIEQTRATIEAGCVVLVDYLQLLDQRRTAPAVQDQVRALRDYAHQTGTIIVIIAQIERAFDTAPPRLPRLEDVRLLNPVDLRLFDKALFVHQGTSRLSALRAGRGGDQLP